MTLPAPIQPKIKSSSDTSNFDNFDTQVGRMEYRMYGANYAKFYYWRAECKLHTVFEKLTWSCNPSALPCMSFHSCVSTLDSDRKSELSMRKQLPAKNWRRSVMSGFQISD